jgi:hypothetical protein
MYSKRLVSVALFEVQGERDISSYAALGIGPP